MTRYLLDTNAVGDWLNDRHGFEKRVREVRSQGAVIGTCEPVVAELFFGVENSQTREANLRLLQRGLPQLKCWPLSRAASEEYGRLAATLRRGGQMIGPIDILIAAIALTLSNCVVVSHDSDLLRIPDLTVEDWRIPDAVE